LVARFFAVQRQKRRGKERLFNRKVPLNQSHVVYRISRFGLSGQSGVALASLARWV